MIMLVSRIRLERILTDPQRRAYNVLGLKEEKNKLGLIVDGDTIWHFLPSILLFSFFSNPIEKKLIFRLNELSPITIESLADGIIFDCIISRWPIIWQLSRTEETG